MIVRKIKPEEVKRTKELFSIAFESEFHNDQDAMTVYAGCMMKPKSREDALPLEKYAAFEEDNQTMMSCLSATSYDMNFDGVHAPMTAIGGVSSLPQYRRQGGIRGCFEKMLPRLYQEGIMFSYLYPFSTIYYRKFGYEMGCTGKQYCWKLDYIPEMETGSGYAVLVDVTNRNTILPDVKKVYEVWQNRYNGMIVNNTFEYTFISEANPYEKQEFTYIYYSEKQKPSAYITFKKVITSEGQKIICSKFIYSEKAGLQGLLQLLKSFASDHVSATFTVPCDCDIESMIKEWSFGAVARELVTRGMIRVVNVKKVLEEANYIGSGEVSLQIEDSCIEENNAVFHIIFQAGKAVSVTEGKTPDIKLDIQTFSEAIFGTCPVERLLNKDSVQLLSKEDNMVEILGQIFYLKKNFIMEYF